MDFSLPDEPVDAELGSVHETLRDDLTTRRGVFRAFICKPDHLGPAHLHDPPRPHIVRGLDDKGITQALRRAENIVIAPAGVELGLRNLLLPQPVPHLDLVRGSLGHVYTVAREVEGLLNRGNGE